MKKLQVEDFFNNWKEELGIVQLSAKNAVKNPVTSPKVQKPGLRIIDHKIKLDQGRIQILGNTEVDYLEKLKKTDLDKAIKDFADCKVPCFIFSKGLKPSVTMKKFLDDKEIAYYGTDMSTNKIITKLNEILAESFAPKATFHGVFMDIHRMGVLILGKSGIGKSECSIELIIHGSKLIADDVVEIKKIGSNVLIGTGPENIRYLLEVRGVGIVNIKDLFGTTSVMEKREIQMVIELDEWDPEKDYDRLGIDNKTYNILDIELPYTVIPVSPGRNVASIIEVAVRNQILKNSGNASEMNFA